LTKATTRSEVMSNTEDMDIQGGSDENSPYEKRWGVKGK
jgi:hypothetical protein